MKSLIKPALLTLAFLSSLPAQAESISNLPQLAKRVVHHFDCRGAHLPANGSPKEVLFKISPRAAGHGGEELTFKNGNDEVVASATAQMVGLTWSRGGRVITMAQAWVQSSSTRALVLIAVDPQNTETQVQVNCEAVTYDQLRASTPNKKVTP